MYTLASYIHHLDPILVEIPGTPLALRWYGLAYVAGFVLGYLVLQWLSRKNLYCVSTEKLGDFVTAVCLFGVLAGGRLGEFFFYWLPERGWQGVVQDPTWVFRVWEGGMASHGGILGVLLVTLWYARKYKLSYPALMDGLAIVSPIGLFFGRVANFINGELYGRIVDAASPLAMKFPQEFYTLSPQKQLETLAALRHTAGVDTLNQLSLPGEMLHDTIRRVCRENEAMRDTLGQFLSPRYPSQLFEALGEGLLIFIVLLVLRLYWRKAPAGIFAALFAFMYAAARIVCECFKEPDAALWQGITRGQYLSCIIAALGLFFLIPAIRQWRNSGKN